MIKRCHATVLIISKSHYIKPSGVLTNKKNNNNKKIKKINNYYYNHKTTTISIINYYNNAREIMCELIVQSLLKMQSLLIQYSKKTIKNRIIIIILHKLHVFGVN